VNSQRLPEDALEGLVVGVTEKELGAADRAVEDVKNDPSSFVKSATRHTDH
jgi:hypothetical protein